MKKISLVIFDMDGHASLGALVLRPSDVGNAGHCYMPFG